LFKVRAKTASTSLIRIPSVILLLALTFVLSASFVLAQSTGVIEAQIVNGTEGGGSTENLTVTLRAFQGMTSELDSRTATADAEGQVRFESLDTSPDIVYALETTYAGVDYASQPLSFEEGGETTLIASLAVYETTENPDQAAIQIERMHMFVDFLDGEISVGELYIFANGGDRTFIGVEEPALGQRITLRFVLPEGAETLRFQTSGEGDRFLITADGFADTEVVRPGTAQQVLYAYTLSYGQADTFDFERLLPYPTANLNVLIPRVGVDVTSDQVELNEIRTLEGQTYLNLNGKGFGAGDLVSVRFDGLQDIVQQPATPSAAQKGFDVKWIALGLAALALAGGLIYPSLRATRKPAPVAQPAEATDVRLSRLLEAIANLDDAFEAGGMDEANYRKQRQALKSEALTLMRES
jgi:hypothetical protein